MASANIYGRMSHTNQLYVELYSCTAVLLYCTTDCTVQLYYCTVLLNCTTVLYEQTAAAKIDDWRACGPRATKNIQGTKPL
jgi:hypothetical protein